ncbi:hypothetical protein MFIFM68171_00928 [Madurella fahalii]|uniref:Uncharacterized protein n=1 Tax=Madurella fahalii TaxID=1157608 RepID=A0ABQ0FZ06_9PEZI
MTQNEERKNDKNKDEKKDGDPGSSKDSKDKSRVGPVEGDDWETDNNDTADGWLAWNSQGQGESGKDMTLLVPCCMQPVAGIL